MSAIAKYLSILLLLALYGASWALLSAVHFDRLDDETWPYLVAVVGIAYYGYLLYSLAIRVL